MSIWYWLDFIFLTAVMFLYWMESVRGEVDPK